MNYFISVVGTGIAHAANCAAGAICPAGTVPDANSNVSFTTLISSTAGKVLEFMFLLGGILAVFYLLYAGLLYITSAGNADKTKLARSGIINAVIGIVVMLSAFFIIRFAIGVGKEISCADTANPTAATQCAK